MPVPAMRPDRQKMRQIKIDRRRKKSMVRAKTRIRNSSGLHLEPAGVLCREASRFTSSVMFEYKQSMTNAKSVLGVLGACVKCGEEIELICDGPDEQEALAAVLKVIEDGLGE